MRESNYYNIRWKISPKNLIYPVPDNDLRAKDLGFFAIQWSTEEKTQQSKGQLGCCRKQKVSKKFTNAWQLP